MSEPYVRVFVFTSAELVSPVSSRRASLDAAYNIRTYIARGMIVLTGHAPYTWIIAIAGCTMGASIHDDARDVRG